MDEQTTYEVGQLVPFIGWNNDTMADQLFYVLILDVLPLDTYRAVYVHYDGTVLVDIWTKNAFQNWKEKVDSFLAQQARQ